MRVDKLRQLCRLREVEREGARARLALAGQTLDKRARHEEAAQLVAETAQVAARNFLADEVADIAPTRDGGSIYAALALGALHRRREAAGAELQHRRAASNRAAAAAKVQKTAAAHAESQARAEALGRRRYDLERAMDRQRTRRADETMAELVQCGKEKV
jgi:hypothetical protein